MKKLLNRITGIVLGLILVAGTGFAIKSSKVNEASAASPVTLTTDALSGTSSDKAISWSSVKGSSGTAPGIYNNAIRLYQGGGFIQLEAKNGAKITGFTAQNTATYASSANYAVSEKDFGTSTPNNAGSNTSVAKSGSYSVSGLSSTYVAIICRGDSKTTRLEISSITVTYTAGKTLNSISINTAPTKVQYIPGEEFDPTGLVIDAEYSTGTEAVAYAGNEADFSFSPSVISEAGDVTITYGEQTCKQAVTLVSVVDVTGVNTAPSSIPVGGTIELDDVLLNVTLSNSGTSTVVPTSLSYDSSVVGDMTVTATYSGASGNQTTSFTVSVVELSSATYSFVNFTGFSDWTNAYGSHSVSNTDAGSNVGATIVFDKASKQGSTITDRPVFGSKTGSGNWTKVVDFTLTKKGYAINSVSADFVQWGTKTPSVALFSGAEVTGTPLTSAKIGTNNTLSSTISNVTRFCIGYSDGSTSSNVQSGITSITIGLVKLADFGTLDHISVSSQPDKLVYQVGDTLSYDGLEITAFDGNDEATASFKDVTDDVTISPAAGYVLTDADAGVKTVTVTYETKETTFDVTVNAVKTFKKITEAQNTWEGQYLIVSSMDDKLYALDSSNIRDEVNNFVEVKDNSGIISAGVQNIFTISSMNGGYSIKSSSNKYIGSLTSSSNGLLISDSEVLNTICFESDVVITGTNGRTLKLNTTSGQERYRYYDKTNTVSLYRLQSATATAYASSFLSGLSCDNGVTAPSTSEWSTLSTSFAALSAEDKVLFKSAAGNVSGDEVAQALARYDYVVAKYGTTSYADFMNRNPQSVSDSRLGLGLDVNNSSSAIICVIALVSMTSLGMICAFKKRKVTNN